MLLMEDILKLSYDMNIYECRNVYRETNRTTNCLAKKCIGITDSKIWLSNFPKDVTNMSFEDYHGLYLIVCVGSFVRSFFFLSIKKEHHFTVL